MSTFTPSLWGLVPTAMKRLSVVGLAKNVGKTTVLNWLIEEGIERQHILGLTSIGVDGEELDVWEGHAKPAIPIYTGMWAVSAKAALADSKAGFRYVKELKASSPLGPVYLVQCTHSGTIKLGGTHLLTDIEMAHTAFFAQGVTHSLIDGAYDRIAAAQTKIAEGFILCTGQTVATDLESALGKTKEILLRWKLPFWSGTFPSELRSVAYMKERQWVQSSMIHAMPFFDQLRTELTSDFEALWIPGALTENMLLKCLSSKRAFPILLDNPTKCFAGQDTLLRWFRKGGEIYVREKSELLALAVNPFSVQQGYSTEPWLAEMKRIADPLPVIDAKRRLLI
ncbi:hypothetical protein [Bacillus horti]|uniref:Uncharacterized protein n=1 Tax=Caldalkalibacillus horti TaxID=77523 RepID=A0ABT9VVS5_9BACI|nr:hypothetical protein [Bacillus horti]MDQ0165097.1 hypothetical protein [Bacillus horti]